MSKTMIYPIEIQKPFENFYGSKKRILLPQEITKIKSISVNIYDLVGLLNEIFVLPVEVKFDLYKFSLLLNNGNDEVMSDTPGQLSLFQALSDWNGGTPLSPTYNNRYYMQKIILNKKIIRNSVHYGIFKMSEELIDYLKINSYKNQFGNYLRSDNFKLILYVEAT